MNLKRYKLTGKKLNNIQITTSYKRLILILFLLSNTIFCNVFANENYVLSTVNKLPITKIDVINRAKIISFAVDKDLQFKNLKNFYNQSFKSLTTERVIEAAGLQLNKNINNIVSKRAYQLTLQDFDNSESSNKGKKNGKKGGRSKRMMATELAKLVNSPDFNLYEFLREPVPKEYGMVQFRIVADHSDNELFVSFDYGDEPESSNLVMTCDRARKSKLKTLFL